jgi:hypothetical protein
MIWRPRCMSTSRYQSTDRIVVRRHRHLFT